ncbi:MAG: hypothetical protein ABW170_20890 [Candidatus Thiodiazotropha sp. L084R]
MTRTAGALIGRRRSSAFWGLGCPKTHHEIKDSLELARSAKEPECIESLEVLKKAAPCDCLLLL